MQKRVCGHLKISPEQCMKVAEELYMNGFISYPRTETDSFPAELDLQEVVGAPLPTAAPRGFTHSQTSSGRTRAGGRTRPRCWTTG